MKLVNIPCKCVNLHSKSTTLLNPPSLNRKNQSLKYSETIIIIPHTTLSQAHNYTIPQIIIIIKAK